MLKLAVFDLDYTVWEPEMYQLWGPPCLEHIESPKVDLSSSSSSSSSSKESNQEAAAAAAKTNQEGMVLVDRSGTPITVFDGASHALSEINRMKKEGFAIQAAVASRTDEPSWAQTCMNHLVAHDGSTLASCFDFVEISFADKKQHFENLHKSTGIPFANMCFFDNEEWNIMSVSRLGVKCIYTPNGMTREAWKEALAHFQMTKLFCQNRERDRERME